MNVLPTTRRHEGIFGLLAASAIISLWFLSLFFLLSNGVTNLPGWLILPAILWQTFLHTGLFITAHDAMHGSVFPDNGHLNDAIGRFCVILYALFSFRKLQTEHWEHHSHPASEQDPDFQDGRHPEYWAWYGNFLKHYVGFWQIVGMAAVFNILEHGMGVAVGDLLLFWVLPSVLSTLQLFTFGTYLPHREQPEGYRDQHRARSNDYGTWWSFVSCYHFGYHWEHHAYPFVPWWKLPRVKKKR